MTVTATQAAAAPDLPHEPRGGRHKSPNASWRPPWIPALLGLVTCLGLALRLVPWNQNRFLEDEALYAYWGLQIASGADPMLDLEPVDKPPLHPYLLALSFTLLGRGEAAARLPSLVASVTGIVLVYALGAQLFSDQWLGLLAAFLVAFSPFDILFASTAFTDPLMTAWTLAAVLAAARGRLGIAGFLWGLAAATKQQGLLFLPLVVVVGLLCSGSRRPRVSEWLRFALAFAVVAACVLAWDASRAQRPGFLEQSVLSYGGLRLTQFGDLWQRAAAWLGLMADFWVSTWFNALLALSMVVWLAAHRLREAIPGPRPLDLALALFIVGFLLLHWCFDFQVWDRYLLCLLPLAALLASRSLRAVGLALRQQAVSLPSRAVLVIAGAAVALLLLGPALQAARSRLSLGGDHGAYDGIDRLAAFVQAEAPAGSVLYHHWLGHHYRFYLYGAPLRLHWFPDPDDLTDDAVIYRRLSRYIAFPSWQDSTAVEDRLASAGVALQARLETTRRDGTVSFRLYQLVGP